jgi:starch-binding outer membrane protein, SusD/RagB family
MVTLLIANLFRGRHRKICLWVHQHTMLAIVFIFVCFLGSCEKLVEIPDSINAVTTEKVFSDDNSATAALMGVYSQMINGGATQQFSCGLATILGSYSSDDLRGEADDYVAMNKLTALLADKTDIPKLWISSYSIGVYGANAILEGIAGSGALSQPVKNQLEGEAKFIRAFSYFYLTNFFGDVPLVLTTDFNQSATMPRTAQTLVYKQIIQDLKDAQQLLPDNYNINNGLRIRANKWAATAMLARVYLYTGDFTNAALQAEAVIKNNNLFSLPTDLNIVFATNSKEAIWQLQQNNGTALGNATPEGIYFMSAFFVPGGAGTVSSGSLSDQLLSAFEEGDKRRASWVTYMYSGNDTTWYPFKYKTGTYNRVIGGALTEHYMALRLAEQYLIRAEAASKGAAEGRSTAIADINEIRKRAGVPLIENTIDDTQLQAVIEKEWQTEFFCEWGHRWLNLKRTGRAQELLSQIPNKQPWAGDHQLLYPVPGTERINNPFLSQNKDY